MAPGIPRGWPGGAASRMTEKRGTAGREGGAEGVDDVLHGAAGKNVIVLFICKYTWVRVSE